ncbi:MAG: site-specific integrase, partial [Planctomycetaceae bacterium]
PACNTVAGQGQTLAELAQWPTCASCGTANVPRTRKPGTGSKRHHGGLTRKKYLDPDTLRAFRQWMAARAKERNDRRAYTDWIIVEILSRTGLRAGELVSTQEHPDRYLRIADLVLTEADPSIEVKVGKGRVSRVVRISTSLAKLLAWYVAEYRKGAGPDDPVICSERCSTVPAQYRSFDVKLKTWTRQYGADKLGLTLRGHVFRHSFAVDFLLKNNNDYVALAEILGHSDASVTMTVYCHTTDGRARQMAERMQ